jgi:NTE family protein
MSALSIVDNPDDQAPLQAAQTPAVTTQTARGDGGPSVAIAFGGGGARGLAHIHIVEAMDEMGIRPVAISGASIGGIIGAAMAAGMRGKDIREFTLATVGSVKEMLTRRVSVGQFDVERILGGFLPSAIPRRFEQLSIPTKIVVTDYYAQCECVCESGDLYNALGASAAIPAVFRPVLRNGRVMIDGGIYNPVPFDHLKGLADIVIGVDVVGGPCGSPDKVPSRLDAMFGANQLMMQSIIAMKLKADPPEVFLRPLVSRFRVMDFLRASEILQASEPVKDELKRALEAAMERASRRAR